MIEDFDSYKDSVEASHIAPYEDLQPSPFPIEGRFESGFDHEILAICEQSYQQSKILALLVFRSNEKGQIFVSMTKYEGEQ